MFPTKKKHLRANFCNSQIYHKHNQHAITSRMRQNMPIHHNKTPGKNHIQAFNQLSSAKQYIMGLAPDLYSIYSFKNWNFSSFLFSSFNELYGDGNTIYFVKKTMLYLEVEVSEIFHKSSSITLNYEKIDIARQKRHFYPDFQLQ